MDKIRRNKFALVFFILPAAILFIGIIIIPILMSVFYSFQDWDGMGQAQFIGLENYVKLFTSKSVGFPKTVGNAMLLAVLSTLIQLPISLFFALILAKGIKGERFFVTVFFVPVLISTVVIGQLWLKIYNPEYGIINSFLRAINCEYLCRTWLGDQDTALMAVFIPTLWQYVGYHMLLMYAGIKNVSKDIIEAATIDGANYWQTSTRIIIPIIRPVLKVCVIFAVTGSLKAFDIIYVLTNGGPAHASEVPSTLLVNMIFIRNRFGFGSTIAVMIIFLCFFFAIAIRKFFKTEDN